MVPYTILKRSDDIRTGTEGEEEEVRSTTKKNHHHHHRRSTIDDRTIRDILLLQKKKKFKWTTELKKRSIHITILTLLEIC